MTTIMFAFNDWLTINECVDQKDNLLDFINNVDTKYNMNVIKLMIKHDDYLINVVLKQNPSLTQMLSVDNYLLIHAQESNQCNQVYLEQ